MMKTPQTSPFGINFISAIKFLVFLTTLVALWQLETTLVMAISPMTEVDRTGLSARVQASLARTTLLTQTASLTSTVASQSVCPAAEEKPTSSSRSMFSIRELFSRAAYFTGALLPGNRLEERVNILLVGSDRGPDEAYGHTDTMILVTIDPVSKSSAMLSIPRDLWVTIPGYGENRINQAFRLGEIKKHPGGGLALLRETIEANLGVPIHFYGMIDYEGFKQVIDSLGGVDICARETINAATYNGYIPSEIDREGYASYVRLLPEQVPADIFQKSLEYDELKGYKFLYVEAGPHTLNGELALQYARTRATVTADFARVRRQQDVLLAIRHKALQMGIIPKIPELWNTMTRIVKTDLQLSDAIQLARLAYEIDLDHIRTEAISIDQTIDYRTASGAQVLLPNREKIKLLVEELFGASNPTASPTFAELEANSMALKD